MHQWHEYDIQFVFCSVRTVRSVGSRNNMSEFGASQSALHRSLLSSYCVIGALGIIFPNLCNVLDGTRCHTRFKAHGVNVSRQRQGCTCRCQRRSMIFKTLASRASQTFVHTALIIADHTTRKLRIAVSAHSHQCLHWCLHLRATKPRQHDLQHMWAL